MFVTLLIGEMKYSCGTDSVGSGTDVLSRLRLRKAQLSILLPAYLQ